MCGLFGWATPRPLDDSVMERGLDALDHRGPDGRGHWRTATRQGGEIALGHTRLAIIDAEGGAQPFFSHDRRFIVSFNGEIYNYIALRESLLARGRRFITRSDTEVLVEAYRTWGVDCLPRLRGMFAFALFGTLTGQLVLARDPFGKKPLFVADMGGGVAFASEIAPLLALPGVDRKLNRTVLADYLLRRYAPGPDTLFQSVGKLPPGCFAIVENGVLRQQRYFTPPLAQAVPRLVARAYAVTAFEAALTDAVRLRLRSDAPYGVYLSGGLDSSVIAALMAREGGAVRSFSAGFDDPAYSESHHAEKAASWIGAEHRSLVVTVDDFARHWPDAVRHRGAPVSEASDIPILILSKAARSSVKMVLTGEGADELLAGYPKHRAERWIGACQGAIPHELYGRLLDPLVRRLPYRARRLKILSRVLASGDPQARSRLWFGNGDLKDVDRLLRCGPQPVAPSYSPLSSLSSLRQIMLADQLAWLPDNLLERGDRMTMAAGIEGRMPFMDVELASLVAGFPDRLLFDRRGGKAILREMAAGLLPATILHRRKAGFRTPVGEWFRGPLKPLLRDLVGDNQSATRRLLDGAVIDRLLVEHFERRTDHTDMLWTLANLELFLREYRLDLEA